MKELLKTAKDFKIIPNNFKSSACLNLLSVQDNFFEAELVLFDDKELSDYNPNSTVEIFGVNSVGLVYFETKIISKNGKVLTLEMTSDYSVIQRREYSRVGLNQGKVVFKDMPENFVVDVCDISAGGIKFITNQPLDIDKHYEISIFLSNNMKIDCKLQIIRLAEEDKKYIVSGKFVDLDNSDRIILVQYAFRIKIEEQSKENE
jgi:c-di-GMP-binding flagellar brake protein YcgR